MAQIARNLTDATAGALTGLGHLIVDRDPLYTAHLRTLLQVAGVHYAVSVSPAIRHGGHGMLAARPLSRHPPGIASQDEFFATTGSVG
jgi:hypothetical protein